MSLILKRYDFFFKVEIRIGKVNKKEVFCPTNTTSIFDLSIAALYISIILVDDHYIHFLIIYTLR